MCLKLWDILIAIMEEVEVVRFNNFYKMQKKF